MTSNVGVKEISNFGKNLGFETEASVVNEQEKNKAIIEKALKKKFKPEFLNRIDETIVFHQLTVEEVTEIVDLMLDRVHKQLKNSDIEIVLSEESKEFLASPSH